MLKVKEIKLSGFRGILHPQELDLIIKGSDEPRSLVLFGLNSSGKTSFVDGLEWFLSEENKIYWLRRDEAEEKAYPHQEAKNKNIDSFVEVEFYDSAKTIGKLTKSFDQKKPTIPIRSDESGFKKIYSSFVIRPYFRYIEVIDFVVSKAGEKYKSLAKWMGFENELSFQEKVGVVIPRELKNYEKTTTEKVDNFEQQLEQLTGGITAISDEVLNFCNGIFKSHKVNKCTSVDEAWNKIAELSKKKTTSVVGMVIEKLTKIETAIITFVLRENLPDEVENIQKKIDSFKKDKKLIGQIDVIGLYTQALGILNKQTGTNTECPVCGKEWVRETLMEHIKIELEHLNKTKNEKEAIEQGMLSLKGVVSQEISLVGQLIGRYKEVQETISEIKYESAGNYLKVLNNIVETLTNILSNTSAQIALGKEDFKKVVSEKESILEQIKAHKVKIQPSADDTKLTEDIEKLTSTKTSWQSLEESRTEQKFISGEIEKFYTLKDEVVRAIQDDVKSRFDEISDRIGKYFGILRNDRDIKDIKIILNEERGKAAGRSAEIELNYYDISVRPAYKVLSESLLNSLGLAVYFACVKQFNSECKFIVLDDIMNSLDIDKRDTLLDLIEQEFSDYQIILFTHDLYWFQKIVRRFPSWIHKKIKGWDYIGGAKIDSITTTKKEIEECLLDASRAEEGGWKLGRHAESILNELCENLQASVRYRYAKNDPPTMEELFDALYARLRDKVKTHPIVKKVLDTKKYEPVLRNFVSHARTNQTASLSPQEIKRASDEWFYLEEDFWCDECNHFVEYDQNKDKIECHCGKRKLKAPPVPKA